MNKQDVGWQRVHTCNLLYSTAGAFKIFQTIHNCCLATLNYIDGECIREQLTPQLLIYKKNLLSFKIFYYKCFTSTEVLAQHFTNGENGENSLWRLWMELKFETVRTTEGQKLFASHKIEANLNNISCNWNCSHRLHTHPFIYTCESKL